ncbi:MAG: hypothetical protein IPM42_12665 [Saprospiraceae bacterium]|nr:hypothetical protein [Saprospiraceae bacterium]
MNTNKIVVAGIIGGVFSFFLGWLLWGILFKDMGASGMASVARADADFIMWAMVVSNLAFGFLLAYIYVQWASIATWLTGAKAGALIGLLMGISFDFSMFAMTTMFANINEILMDIVLNVVYVALTGAVIGAWLGWKK